MVSFCFDTKVTNLRRSAQRRITNKIEQVRLNIAMLKRQFLQDDTGVFDQALGDQEVAAVVTFKGKAGAESLIFPGFAVMQTGWGSDGGVKLFDNHGAAYAHRNIAIRLTGAFRLEYEEGRVLVHVQLRCGFQAEGDFRERLAAFSNGAG